MLSRLTGITVVALLVGVFLVPVADAATTYKCVFHTRQTALSIGALFSFDGTTTDDALVLGSGTALCPTKPDLGGAYNSEEVNEVSIGSSPCSFTGLFGEAENGVTVTLVGASSASDLPNGSLFYGSFTGSGSGCISTSGAFTFTETDTLFGGTGIYKRQMGGSATYTSVGLTLATGATGFFQWSRTSGKSKITLP